MKTVSMSGKKVKFSELNDGAIFVDGSYDNSIYIKTAASVNIDKHFGLCIYSSGLDCCIEGYSYSFPDDCEVIELDINIEIIPKRG